MPQLSAFVFYWAKICDTLWSYPESRFDWEEFFGMTASTLVEMTVPKQGIIKTLFEFDMH